MLVMALALAQAAIAAPPTGGQSLQQMFDAASQALERGDYAAAVADFEALEPRLPSARSRAVARARKGQALVGLKRIQEGTAVLRAALADLPADDATIRADRYAVAITLASVEELAFDYASARQDYALAETFADQPTDRLAALIGHTRTTIFYDPAAAVALADQLQATIAKTPSATSEMRGMSQILKGRALLNAGQVAQSRIELLAAVRTLGGLTLKVNINDVAARSDLALAATLAGDRASAKEYLAYSGAGTQEQIFALGADMNPPACGEDGLSPDDVAVIEFGVADDGSVTRPVPVYSTARDDKALAFARAVAGWSWTAEDAAKIPAFFRAQTRLEMRCTNQFARPGIMSIPRVALRAWLDDNKVVRFDPRVPATAAVPLLTAELDRRAAAQGEAITLIPILMALAESPVTAHDPSMAWLKRASTIADRLQAPPLVRTMFLAQQLMGETSKSQTGSMRELGVKLAALRDAPGTSKDARSQALLTILIADTQPPRRSAEIESLLNPIAADQRLDSKDPFRIAALTRIASIRARHGDLDQARAAYLQTGLSAQQCALTDVSPARLLGRPTTNDIPQDAINWHISGWAETEFDIQADGRTSNVRTVIAYPPFVYGPPMVKVEMHSRYTQSYRPDGGLGCGAFRTTQRFRIIS